MQETGSSWWKISVRNKMRMGHGARTNFSLHIVFIILFRRNRDSLALTMCRKILKLRYTFGERDALACPLTETDHSAGSFSPLCAPFLFNVLFCATGAFNYYCIYFIPPTSRSDTINFFFILPHLVSQKCANAKSGVVYLIWFLLVCKKPILNGVFAETTPNENALSGNVISSDKHSYFLKS